jgi:hypothetical protein
MKILAHFRKYKASWIKEAGAKNKDGNRVSPHDKEAYYLDLASALRRFYPPSPVTQDKSYKDRVREQHNANTQLTLAAVQISGLSKGQKVIDWANEEERTYEELMELLETARV